MKSLAKKLADKSIPFGDCVIWLGWTDSNDRPRIRIDGKWAKVHRIVWELTNGPIPVGSQINHKCDNTLCIRLAHLYCGTQADNIHDMQKRRTTFPRWSEQEAQDIHDKFKQSGLSEKEFAALNHLRWRRLHKLNQRMTKP